jgi:DNA repair photolyase
MSRKTIFVPYSPKTVLNKGKRADHWFWTRYSAYPYLGCQHGCAFCYCREQKYYPYDDVDDFAHVIKVKQNAPRLLRQALSRAPLDAVFTGDYQAAERRFGLSRQMLEVCRDLGFPVVVLTRSPLVVRDLDILCEINERARAVVAFSMISAPGAPSYERVCAMERLAPPAAKRLAGMAEVARAGIQTGACVMPIVPGLTDDDATLRSVARAVGEHGGSFILAGGLTLADQQRQYFFDVLQRQFPDLLPLYRRMYPAGSYGAAGWSWPAVGRRIRAICEEAGVADRMARPVVAGDKRALNKRVVEALANEVYRMEIEGAAPARIWAYRKAAWAIEDLPQALGLVYQTMGLKGVQSIENVGPELGAKVERLITSKA